MKFNFFDGINWLHCIRGLFMTFNRGLICFFNALALKLQAVKSLSSLRDSFFLTVIVPWSV